MCKYIIGHPKLYHIPDLAMYHKSADECIFDAQSCSNYFGFVKATILPLEKLFLPILWHKANAKLYFPLCQTCADEENHREDCWHTDGQRQRQLTGVWPSFELQLALENGYEAKQIHGIWHWPERSTDLFNEYIRTFLKLKAEASGLPAKYAKDLEGFVQLFEEAEKIQLDKDSIVKNPGK